MFSVRSWCLIGGMITMLSVPAVAQNVRVYVGTYTTGTSEGIYTFEMDSRSGKPTQPKLAAKVTNPSFLAIHPNKQFLYAVAEVTEVEGQKGKGGVHSFKIDHTTGELTSLNAQLSQGESPCHLTVDATGKVLLVANYGSGNVAALPINEDGTLEPASSVMQHEGSSIDPRRQKGPHAHSVNIDRNNQFAIAADLGLDQLLVYRLDPNAGTLTPHSVPAHDTEKGGGPRHFCFHPHREFAYHCNEMGSSVTAHIYNADTGTFKALKTVSTLPEGASAAGNSTAEVIIGDSGRFVYCSNRGHNSIAVFEVRDDGNLKLITNVATGGEIPRNFAIDPSGNFLLAANQKSSNVVIFNLDPRSGKPQPNGEIVAVPNPVCIRFLTVD